MDSKCYLVHGRDEVYVRMGNSLDSVLIARGPTEEQALLNAAERVKGFAKEINEHADRILEKAQIEFERAVGDE